MQPETIKKDMVPNIIHFVYGLVPGFGGKPFMLCHYLAIRSAYEVNKPSKIYFVCAYEPESEWFERSRKYIEIVKITAPQEIFGNKLHHYAHQSDVIRLERLLEYGGIYLDLDTICVKPLTPLLNHEFVMGKEYVMWSEHAEEPPKKYYKGLCNAVIIAHRNSAFLRRWYESYRSFRSTGKGHFWAEHSVVIPGQLAEAFPDELFIADEEAFFSPSHSDEELKNLFEYNKTFPNAYVHHLWETLAWEKYLSGLSVASVMESDTTYNKLARRFLDESDISKHNLVNHG
jgi:hypothetical protein